MRPMNKFLAILHDTFLEIISRKMIYFFGAVTLFMTALFLIVPTMTINGQDVLDSGIIPPEAVSNGIAFFFNAFFGFLFLLMVFGSAGLLPSYMEKGRIELTLSKPIGRIRLLSMKFLSVYLIMISIFSMMTSILWLVLSIRLGHFSGHFFYGLLFDWVIFLVIYAIVFCLGVISRSTAMSIIGYFVIITVASLLMMRDVLYSVMDSKALQVFLDTSYHILPKLGEMGNNSSSLMLGNGFVNSYPIYSSLGFAVVVFLVALLVFHRRDF